MTNLENNVFPIKFAAECIFGHVFARIATRERNSSLEDGICRKREGGLDFSTRLVWAINLVLSCESQKFCAQIVLFFSGYPGRLASLFYMFLGLSEF